MNSTVYCDHAATAFPKAPGVKEAMASCIGSVGGNAGRGSYAGALKADEAVFGVREKLARLFSAPDASCVLFTPGQTFSLNAVLFGFLRPGDHVIVSPLEHNAVMRPLNALSARGVGYSVLPWSASSGVDAAALDALLRPDTKLVLATHASNVSGEILPVEEIGKVCAAHGIPLCLDAAQTAGHVPLGFSLPALSALCVPGHKGLLGPEGVGALLLTPEFAKRLDPFVFGGTGSRSESFEQPLHLPDRFESGTLNLPGILGLGAAVDFIADTGVKTLRKTEQSLTARFLLGVTGLPGVHVTGPASPQSRVGVVSLDFERMDNALAADALAEEYNIAVRCGLHCAPMAHRTFGTFPRGTVRFSFGYGNTEKEIDRAIAAVQQISKR